MFRSIEILAPVLEYVWAIFRTPRCGLPCNPPRVVRQRACVRSRRGAARCGWGAGGWAVLARLQRLAPELERALAPASPAPYAAVLQHCQHSCVRSLEEWLEAVRGDGAAGPVDGTVHQLAAAALAHLHALAAHMHTIGEPAHCA